MAKGLIGILALLSVIVLAGVFVVAFETTHQDNIKVYGTEYKIGEDAKSWLQLLNANGSYIENASCFVSLDRPDGTSYFSNVEMEHQNKGIYYYDYRVPVQLGVFPVTAVCYYVTSTTSFQASSGSMITGNSIFNSYTATYTDDSSYWYAEENGATPRRITTEFNFTVTEPNLTASMSIPMTYRWDGGTSDLIYFYIYNWTSDSWLQLPNTISNSGGSFLQVVNTISTDTNFTFMGLVNSTNGRVRVRLNDTTTSDTSRSDLDMDYIAVRFIYLTSPSVEEIKGSSEIHVSSDANHPYEMVTNCGSEYDFDSISDLSYCSAVIPQSESPSGYPEGELWDNITINAFDTREGYWVYETPEDIVCNALIGINQTNSSFGEGTAIDLSSVLTVSGVRRNCQISVPISMDASSSYYYQIYLDNYISYNMFISNYRQFSNIKNFSEELCYPLAVSLGYNYTTPINTLSASTNNTILYTCELQLDELYWFEQYYNSSLTVSSVGELTKYVADSASTMADIIINYGLLADYYTRENAGNITVNVNQTDIFAHIQS